MKLEICIYGLTRERAGSPLSTLPPLRLIFGGGSAPSEIGMQLPNITKRVIIDGYLGSPGGATPNTDRIVTNAVLTVVINGSNYKVGDGLSSGTGQLSCLTEVGK